MAKELNEETRREVEAKMASFTKTLDSIKGQASIVDDKLTKMLNREVSDLEARVITNLTKAQESKIVEALLNQEKDI